MDARKLPVRALGILALASLLMLALGGVAVAKGTLSKPVIAQAAAKSLSKKSIVKLVKKEAKKAAKKNPGPQGPAGPPGPPGATGGAGGTTAQKFACKTNQGISDPSCGTVFNQDGMRLQAECAVNGLTVRSSAAGSVMTLFGVQSNGVSFGLTNANTAINDGFTLTPSGAIGASGVATYTPANSSTVLSVNFAAVVAPGSPQGDCVFYGTIVRA